MDPRPSARKAIASSTGSPTTSRLPNSIRSSRDPSPAIFVRALPDSAPEDGEPFDAIFADFEQHVVPGLTHWNHPGFFAYFAISAQRPGHPGGDAQPPASTSRRCCGGRRRRRPSSSRSRCDWLRSADGLPSTFEGVIYDTASISTLHALAAAREVVGARRPRSRDGRAAGPSPAFASTAPNMRTRPSTRPCCCSDSGSRRIHRIPADHYHRCAPTHLAEAIADDRRAGLRPLAVVATVGTTSSTAVDPVATSPTICEARRRLAARGRCVRRRDGDGARLARVVRRAWSVPTRSS